MISIIICSIDADRFAAVRETYARHIGDARYEIVGIHDARSLCEGYNRGMRRARGDIVVFSHDDIELLSDDVGATLERHLAEWHVVGVAGTTRMHAMGWANSGAGFRLEVCLDIRLIHFSEGTVDEAWLRGALSTEARGPSRAGGRGVAGSAQARPHARRDPRRLRHGATEAAHR